MGRAVLLVVVLGCAACDEAPTVVVPIDGYVPPDIDESGGCRRTLGCNPVAQTGCNAGNKCTWIRLDQDGHGEIGCVIAGTVPTGGACAYGPDGELTGYDDCVAGDTCVGGRCARTCVDSPDTCEGQLACVDYDGHFCPATNFGACATPCDPVLGATDCPEGFSCTGDGGGTFSCTVIADASTTRTHGDVPYGPDADTTYVNGCAPGYLPLLRASTDAEASVMCTAMCRPGEVHAGLTADNDGVVGSGYTCADRGATAAGTECHRVWSLTPFPELAQNSIGFCWTPSSYVGDWDRDTATPDAPWPSCTTLTTGLVDSNGDGTPDVPEHRYYGCAPLQLGEDPDVGYARPLGSGIGGNGSGSL